MIVKLLPEYHLESLSAEAYLGKHLSKCHIVENLMPRLNCKLYLILATGYQYLGRLNRGLSGVHHKKIKMV